MGVAAVATRFQPLRLFFCCGRCSRWGWRPRERPITGSPKMPEEAETGNPAAIGWIGRREEMGTAEAVYHKEGVAYIKRNVTRRAVRMADAGALRPPSRWLVEKARWDLMDSILLQQINTTSVLMSELLLSPPSPSLSAGLIHPLLALRTRHSFAVPSLPLPDPTSQTVDVTLHPYTCLA